MAILQPSDLEAFATIDEAKAQAMIDDALATARLLAPCITTEEFLNDADLVAALRAILRGAVLRWNDVGAAGRTTRTDQQTAGPYSQTQTESFDNTQQRRGMFWPSEITELRRLCSQSGLLRGKAYTVDTTPRHTPPDPLLGALVNGPRGWAPGEVPR